MILHPPFFLHGEAGKTFGADGYLLAGLSIMNATLSIRSMDTDVLTFSLRDNGHLPILPEDNQWITLRDSTGQRLFTGITKRSFSYPQCIYSYAATNIYQGLLETPLLTGDRAYVLFDSADIGALCQNLLARAAAAGLAIQAPTSFPTFYAVPKMAFRASTIGAALEDVLRWCPDVASRMDYSTDPPTLRFFRRSSTPARTLELRADGHGISNVTLSPFPEARALSIAFAYAEREGDSVVNYRLQTAGNDAAEARRKTSIYLSGQERMDMMVSEAVMSGNKAIATANASLAAANAAIAAVNAQISADYAAAVAAIPGTTDTFNYFAYLIANDSALAADPNLGWANGGSVYGYLNPGIGLGQTDYNLVNFQISGVDYSHPGWPVSGSPFTAAQLAIAGATSTAGAITGNLIAPRPSNGNHSFPFWCSYYGAGHYFDATDASNDYYSWIYHPINQSVNILSKAPSVIRGALLADAAATQAESTVQAAVGNSSLIDRAEFVSAPPGLAQNYFAAQDWTPYKGGISTSSVTLEIPTPGEFINVTGEQTPSEWATMKSPVSEASIDLRNGSASVTLGPSPRMDYSNISDRLRVPTDDNYQPG